MTQFTNGNRTYLFVELPEGTKHPQITHNAMWYSLHYRIDDKPKDTLQGWECIKLPQGDWKIVGIVQDLTEEQCIPLVECLVNEKNNQLYRNYEYGIPQPVCVACISAKESFYSLLRKNRFLLNNPYGESRPEHCYDVLWDQEGDDAVEQWDEAQKSTIGHTLLLTKDDK